MKTRKERIYISGKITGTTDYMERFAAVEEWLTKQGYTVINPAKVNSMLPEGTPYEDYMKMSFCMIDLCDCILMMEQWDDSRGAIREYYYAISKCIPVLFEKVMRFVERNPL